MAAREVGDSAYCDLGAIGRYASLWSFGLQVLGFHCVPPQALCFRPLSQASLDSDRNPIDSLPKLACLLVYARFIFSQILIAQ